MPPNEKSAKFYYTVGKIVVFVFRWVFYIGLFYLAFLLGGKQGTLKERFQQLEFPKIRIIRPPGSSSPSSSAASASFSYYVVVVGSFGSREEGEMLQAQLRAQRIHSYIVNREGAYLVCVGKYRNPKKAEYTLKQVQAGGFSQAKIVSPSS